VIIAAVSEATWGFLGVLVANAVILAGLFLRQGKQSYKVDQINKAVNHQPEGSPTLVERVGTVEQLAAELAEETAAHRTWEHKAFTAIAEQIGVTLPPLPAKETTSHDHPIRP
jgi:hypothetical protein